jgi:hypothetical protein
MKSSLMKLNHVSTFSGEGHLQVITGDHIQESKITSWKCVCRADRKGIKKKRFALSSILSFRSVAKIFKKCRRNFVAQILCLINVLPRFVVFFLKVIGNSPIIVGTSIS